MNWELISQMATTFGTLVAAVTLIAGYRLYKIGKRDDYVARLRAVLSACQARAATLAELFGLDMVHEQAVAVVTDPTTRHQLRNIFDRFVSRAEASEADLENYLQNELLVSAPIRGATRDQFMSLISAIQTDIAPYQLEFPGFYRVVDSARSLFRNLYFASADMVRSNEVWKDILLNEIFTKRQDKPIRSPEDLEHAMIQELIATNAFKISERDQKDINDFLAMIEIVTTAYLEKTEAELMAQSRAARGEDLKNSSEIDTIVVNLREAEKCLKYALTQEQLLAFRERTSKFDARNPTQ